MKHRSFILVALAIIPSMAAAQTPPLPPLPPLPPEPTVVAKPLAPLAPLPPLKPIDGIFSDDLRRLAENAKWAAKTAVMDIDHVRIAEEAKWAAQDAMRGIDFKKIAEDAKWAAQDALRGLDLARISEDAKWQAQEAIRAIPKFDFRFDFDNKFSLNQSFNSNMMIPKQQWIQGDPADSIYQLAREAFNRQDFSRAAARFGELLAKYPNFRRIADAAYYQASALYRVGTLESLRNALKVLETNAARLQYDSRQSEAPVLQGQILRALVQRGESGADNKLRELYARYPAVSCDADENRIKSSVLNSLFQSNQDEAMPYIRRYLATRDSCSAELRKTAVMLIGQRPGDDKTALLVQVAREDTVRDVRQQAIEVLSRMPGDAAINALQELMKDPDERVQRAAVRSLMRNDNPRARVAMRALIDRRDASEAQRIEAIQSFDRDNTSPDDATYLRNLYNRQGESDRIKEAVITALARSPSDENINFLIAIAKNQNETSSLRAHALNRISRSTLQIDELIKLYDASDSRSMRQSLVSALGSRKEEAAVNKLLDIAKLSTDYEVRRYAIQILLNKNDPAITKKVLDLIK